jgi:GAF domain-containing protein
MAETERPLVKVLASFADTLVSEFDVSELFYRLVDSCTQLADADEAGLLLMDKEGKLGIAAATSESARLVELLQLQASEGPCLDAFRSGEPVQTGPLTSEQAEARWPKFAPMAASAGFDSVVAVPMRLRDTVLGSLNLFRLGPGEATDRDVTSVQILADLATIAIVQDRVVEDARTVIDQLQTALDTRVSIEQAKGIIAARSDLDVTTAFERIRSYARSSNSRLSEVSARIISGELSHESLTSQAADEF